MKNKQLYAILILVIFHVIGISLFIIDPAYSSMSYMNMIICAVLVFLSESHKPLMPLLVISAGGYILELIGVKTGLLFGDYNYDTALGLKLFDVPLVIGLNWYCVVVSSSSLVKRLNAPLVVKAILAGILCTFLDFLIEPVAIRYNFWTWNGDEIPIFNYVCWFVFTFLFALLYLKSSKGNNRTAQALYVIWIVFFTLLILI